MMTNIVVRRSIAALGTSALLVALCAVPAAQADPAELGSAYTAAAKITRGAGLDVAVTTGGDLADLFDYLAPVLDQVVDPVSSRLSSLSSQLTSDIAAGITGADYTATSIATALPQSADGFPDCGSADWSQGNCYGPAVPNVDDAPVVDVTDGSTRGYATADEAGSYAVARSGGASLTVLGLQLGSLGVSRSAVTCLAGGSCQRTSSVSGVGLLGGALAVQTADDGAIEAAANGGAFAGLSAFTDPVDVSGDGMSAQAQAQDGALRLTVQLSLDQLLSGLDVADALDDLGSADAGSTATLTLTLSSHGTSGDGRSASWGLDVGIGLSVDLKISVVGVMTAEVSAQDATATGNLADIELAYTAAAGPDAATSGGAQPQLT